MTGGSAVPPICGVNDHLDRVVESLNNHLQDKKYNDKTRLPYSGEQRAAPDLLGDPGLRPLTALGHPLGPIDPVVKRPTVEHEV